MGVKAHILFKFDYPSGNFQITIQQIDVQTMFGIMCSAVQSAQVWQSKVKTLTFTM